MKLAIVGSVVLTERETAGTIDDILERYTPELVISGGAKGVDSAAVHRAYLKRIATMVYRPITDQWDGPGGYKERNARIAKACDVLIRIVSKRSKTYGSGWTRDYADRLGKITREIVLP